MSRLSTPDYEDMTSEQQRVHDIIIDGPRGSLRGPFKPWLVNPGFAEAAQAVGEYCRFNTSLTKTQFGTMPVSQARANTAAVAQEIMPYFKDDAPSAGATAAR